MNSEAHIQEAIHYRSEALKDARQALYTWLGVAGCTALGSEVMKNVLLNGRTAEATSELVENTGQIVAGTILAAGLVSATWKGGKAVYHGLKIHRTQRQEAEAAKLYKFTPPWYEHPYNSYSTDSL
jgi:hypothetical protein